MVAVLALLFPGGIENSSFASLLQRIFFAVPLLFAAAAFLAYRISETEIVLISLSFLAVSLSDSVLRLISSSGNFSADLTLRFFRILPFMNSFALSAMFLLPHRQSGSVLTIFKIILAVAPLSFFSAPALFEELLLRDFLFDAYSVPWPGAAAAFFPLVSIFICRNRQAAAFSPALTVTLLLFMLPWMLSLDNFFKDGAYLTAGMIILHSIYRRYWENSYIDELTGLYNRRALEDRMRRLGKRYSLAMADVDHFKNFNDTYGHNEGDNVLRLVSGILKNHFRSSVYRYGGEEFCVVFRKTEPAAAAEMMNDAREEIAVRGFSIRRSQIGRKKSGRKTAAKNVKRVNLTVSAGVAASGKNRTDGQIVLQNADKALYRAKENGRNRVEVFSG